MCDEEDRTSDDPPSQDDAAPGPTEAEHIAMYLRRLDRRLDALCRIVGLTRESLRAGAEPGPDAEATPEERVEVSDTLESLERISALAVEAGYKDVALPYAEGEVLRALESAGREMDAEELRLWLAPVARETLLPEDSSAALERLAGRDEIRSRTVLIRGGEKTERIGGRVFVLRSSFVHRVYAYNFRV